MNRRGTDVLRRATPFPGAASVDAVPGKRYNFKLIAAVAQLVERNLAKVEVESSRLFCRSRFTGEA